MLMTISEARQIVQDCHMRAKKRSNGYAGNLADLQVYQGKYGAGYTITSKKITEYWVFPTTYASRSVYDGGYSVKDACITANNISTVKYGNVNITPCWRFELDTVTGKTDFRRTENLHPAVFAGQRLTVTWRGAMDARALKRKIRRKMREAIKANKAFLITNNTITNNTIT